MIMYPKISGINTFYIAIVVLAVITLASLSITRAEIKPCPWTVVSMRHPSEIEGHYTDTAGGPWPPTDARIVPGPDSLCIVVQNDSERHPHVYLKDLRTGSTQLLLREVAFSPRWSPDGKYVACIVSRSRSRPPGHSVLRWDLAIIELASRKKIAPALNSSSITIKWSPDSKSLLGAGLSYDAQGSVLYCVSLPKGTVSILDTVGIHADYEFDWSPDSKWVAVSRPTKLLPSGDISKSDLWILSRTQDTRCKVLDTPEWVEREPRWITDRTIMIERASWEGNQVVEEAVVIELALGLSFDSRRSVNHKKGW